MLRGIVERETAAPKAPTPPSAPSDPSSSSSGFPAIVHRFQRTTKRPSAFANRNAQSGLHIGRGVDSVPSVQAGPSSISAGSVGPSNAKAKAKASAGSSTGVGQDLSQMSEAERIRREVDAENTARVADMTSEEREQEAAELTERFGPGLMEAMRKRRDKRLAAEQGEVKRETETVMESPVAPRDEGSAVAPMTEAQRVYKQVDQENQQRVETMSAEEREQELKELEERFGKGVMEMLKRRAMTKAGGVAGPSAERAAERPQQTCMYRRPGSICLKHAVQADAQLLVPHMLHRLKLQPPRPRQSASTARPNLRPPPTPTSSSKLPNSHGPSTPLLRLPLPPSAAHLHHSASISRAASSLQRSKTTSPYRTVCITMATNQTGRDTRWTRCYCLHARRW